MATPSTPPRRSLDAHLAAHTDDFLRVALSQYVTNGLSVTLGLVVIMLLIFEAAGLAGASSAAVGVLIASLPDVPAPRKRKIMQMLPAPLLGTPLFMLVQLVHDDVLLLGVVLVVGTFLAVMLMAWGKRGGPLTFSLLFSMLFAMAAPPVSTLAQILVHGGWFALGAGLYLLWGVLTTHWLNTRFRNQLLAECLHGFAQILRTQAQRFAPNADPSALLAKMLQQQAAFADHLQATRDVVLESPTTPTRTRWAAMLLGLLEARDHQLACDLDLDTLLQHQDSPASLPALQHALNTIALQLEGLSLSLLLERSMQAIAPIANLRDVLTGMLPVRPKAQPLPEPLAMGTPDAGALLHNIAARIGHINDEAVHLAALARGDASPELAAVRSQWQLFVSPTHWAWAPLLRQLSWRAPTLRYALRATLAVAAGYAVSLHLPWAAHKYWILMTIVVVMRGNLAQTLQRRDARVAGTLLGCVLVMALLAIHPGARMLFLVIALSMGLAHAFALRRYLFTTIFATLAGLLQAHLLMVGAAPTFAVFERLGDTVLGAALAWLFSYVLPAWERSQLPGLVRRSLQAQLQHAKLALALGEPTQQSSDLPWRLARREAYDSLSALTLATQRSLAEPDQVRPPLAPLEAVQARSYQLLAQLTSVKSLLLLRRSQLDMAVATPALQEAARQIGLELTSACTQEAATAWQDAEVPSAAAQPFEPRPDPLTVDDLTPWLLRRLTLATAMARELQHAASLAQQHK